MLTKKKKFNNKGSEFIGQKSNKFYREFKTHTFESHKVKF